MNSKDFNKIFVTTEDKQRLIEIYHKFDNNKQDLFQHFFPAIQQEFEVEIEASDRERFRSWFKRVRRGQDLAYANVNNIDTKESITPLLDSVKVERIKLQDERRELKKLVVDYARFDHIKELIKESAETIAKQKPLAWYRQQHFFSEKDGVCLISDWHYGLTTTNFINTYNKSEFLRRVNILTYKTIEYGKQNSIKTLHVVNLGDTINGLIHTTTRLTNAEDVVTQTQEVSEVIAEMLCKFANEFESVRYYSVLDNHSRIMQDKKESLTKESLARFIPWFLVARLGHVKNLQIVENHLDDEIAVFDVCGNTCFAVHGHRDNIKDVVQNMSLMIREFPKVIFTAHVHHNVEDEIHGCEVVVNPSLSGVDEYALNLRRTANAASKMMIFDDMGREITYHIRLQ